VEALEAYLKPEGIANDHHGGQQKRVVQDDGDLARVRADLDELRGSFLPFLNQTLIVQRFFSDNFLERAFTNITNLNQTSINRDHSALKAENVLNEKNIFLNQALLLKYLADHLNITQRMDKMEIENKVMQASVGLTLQQIHTALRLLSDPKAKKN